MVDRPEQPPEGKLIAEALKRSGLSQRKAAERADISETRWRQIVGGYQRVSGTDVPVHAPAETIARMAQVVGITAQQMAGAGRDDVAAVLREAAPTGKSTDPLDDDDRPITRGELRQILQELRGDDGLSEGTKRALKWLDEQDAREKHGRSEAGG